MGRVSRSLAVAGIAGMVAIPLTASAASPAWHQQNSHTFNVLKGIDVINACHGWAVGEPPDTGSSGLSTPIVATSNGGRSWYAQNSGLTDTTLNRVDFVDNTHGWAVGEPHEISGNSSTPGPGTIIATTNGGKTWTPQTNNVTPALDPNVENDLEGLSFISPQQGWIAVSSYTGSSNSGAILHTTDGGATYSPQVIPDPLAGIADVYFTDSQNGWALADSRFDFQTSSGIPAKILHTTNGGVTWTEQFTSPDPNGSSFEAIKFFDASDGAAVGDAGQIFRTKDGGTTWTGATINAPAGTYTNTTFTDVAFPMERTVAVSAEPQGEGIGTKILLSSNGGATFTPQTTAIASTINSISFAKDTHSGWASGENGVILSNDPKAGAHC